MAGDVPSNGPVMSGSLWFLWVFSGLFLATRVYAKLSRRQRLWWDDFIMIFAWICLLCEVALTQACINLGFGRHVDAIEPANVLPVALLGQAGLTMSALAINASKISFATTLLRLTHGRARAFVWFCIVSLALFMAPALVLPWVQCAPAAKALVAALPGTCWHGGKRVSVNYAIFEAVYTAATDFTLAALPWWLLRGVRMRRAEKVGVGVAMSLGAVAGVAAVAKAVYMVQLAQVDFSFDGVHITIWTAAESAVSIVAASMPVLRVFIREAVSGRDYYYGGGTAGGREIALSKLSRGNRANNHDGGGGMSAGGGGGGGVDGNGKIGASSWISLDDDGDGDGDGNFLRRESVVGTGELPLPGPREGILRTVELRAVSHYIAK